MVDLGGSLAVASRGLYATGVSTDLNGKCYAAQLQFYVSNPNEVTYLNSGGKVGDVLKAVVTCDKCKYHRVIFFGSHISNTRVVGKTLAYTSIQFTNSKGEVAARGSHTKLVFTSSLSNPQAK